MTFKIAARWILFLSIMMLALRPVQAEVLTFIADKGPSTANAPSNIYTFSGAGALFDGKSRDITPPEGFESFKTVQTAISYAGWSFAYTTAQDLSRFNTLGINGVLKFWAYCDSGNVTLNITKSAGLPYSTTLSALGWTPAVSNQWVEYTVPLAGIDLTNTLDPFVFTLQTAGTLYFDNVRYVSSTASPFFNVSLKNVSDNSAASALTWNSLGLPSGWVRADQFLNVELDSDLFSWGLQVYTDNKAPDANPTFVTAIAPGQVGSNPAGLVNISHPSIALPMAWSVHSDTTSPIAAEPNLVLSDPNAYQWLYMADRQTPAIALQNTIAFADGSIENTVQNNQGIHFGQANTQIGATDPPVKVFLEANFSTATAPNTYQTTALRLEYYTQ